MSSAQTRWARIKRKRKAALAASAAAKKGLEERVDEVGDAREKGGMDVDMGDEVVEEVSDDGWVDVDPPTPACERPFTLDTPQAAQSAEFSGSNAVFIGTFRQLFKFVQDVNTFSKCSTEGCQGKLRHVSTRLVGLGGDCEVSFKCTGCLNRQVTYPASPVHAKSGQPTLSIALQVASICTGLSYAQYKRLFGAGLGMKCVSHTTFNKVLRLLFSPSVALLNEQCDLAKNSMKAKAPTELGSWERAVTVADGAWQTRGHHSQNFTLHVRDYMTGGILYFKHLCQRGKDDVISEPLFEGTSNSAEGYAASLLLSQAKREGMNLVVNWQDGDSTSAIAVRQSFPNCKVMRCGGHSAKSHYKQLHGLANMKKFSGNVLEGFRKQVVNVEGKFGELQKIFTIQDEQDIPPKLSQDKPSKLSQDKPSKLSRDMLSKLSSLVCHCEKKHSGRNCGCLKESFIFSARAKYIAALADAGTDPEKFSSRLAMLYHHALNEHEWEGGKCDFHPLIVCACGKCEKGDVKCEGKPYRTSNILTCPFHRAAYEYELIRKSCDKNDLIHTEMGKGHTNQSESAHSVLIHFRPKSLHLHRLHCQVSTNLGLLQSNQGFIEKVKGTKYHWYPDLLEAAEVPVYDGIVPMLKLLNAQRVKRLEKAREEESRKKRRQWKHQHRRVEQDRRKEWGMKQKVQHGYGKKAVEGNSKRGSASGTCKCGSTTHKRTTHRDCPLNKGKKELFPPPPKPDDECGSDIKLDFESCSDVESDASECMMGVGSEAEFSSDEDDILPFVQLCECPGAADKRSCPLNPRNSKRPDPFSRDVGDSKSKPPPVKAGKYCLQLGQYVCVHNRMLGKFHVVCRIVDVVGRCYRLYCSSGLLDRAFSSDELTPVASERTIPLYNWRRAGKVSMRSLASDTMVVEPCHCDLPPPPESIVIDSESDERGEAVRRVPDVWVTNEGFSLSREDEKLVTSPTGWLTDKIIEAAQLLVLQEFPSMQGLQHISLQEVSGFGVLCGEFVQVINVEGNHWCVVSTVGCEEGGGNVYDSLCSRASVSDCVVCVIAKMLFSQTPKLDIRVMDVEWQTNGSDCGVLSIAYVFDLCCGRNPCSVVYDPANIRQHLAMCLKECCVRQFPVLCDREYAPSGKSVTSVELHCSCRMPEFDGDRMACCDSCSIWYHKHCMDIPEEVFGDESIDWLCRNCVN